MKKIKETILFIKKPAVYITAIIIIASIVIPILINRKNNQGEKIIVGKQDIVQTVSVSGKTKPASSVGLGFEKSGKVDFVGVQVGDKVYKGETIARLDSSDLYAGLEQAKANLLVETIRLEEMKKGTRTEELEISKTQLISAEDSFNDAKIVLDDSSQDAYTKTDDAIRNSIDQFFDNPRGISASINVATNNFQLEYNINKERVEIENMLNNWDKTKISTNLEFIKSFLDKVSIVINSLTTDSNISQATIDKYKTAVSLSRTNINLAISSFSAAQNGYNSAKSALDIAQKQYNLKLAGNTKEAIGAQEARVAQMKAAVSNNDAMISKNVIYSPIDGLVVKQDAKVGQIVIPGIELVSVISADNLEIEAYVPEINIGKISIGNFVSLTLDAFPNEKFSGKLVYIDPAETLIDNVPNFKLKIVFDKVDLRMKSGLTVNIDIEVGKKENVVAIPRYAIDEENEKYFVNKFNKSDSSEDIKTEVNIGAQGDNGFTEIISGLNEGETVVFYSTK